MQVKIDSNLATSSPADKKEFWNAVQKERHLQVEKSKKKGVMLC